MVPINPEPQTHGETGRVGFDLSEANLTEAKCVGTIMSRCVLHGAIFNKADLFGADFMEADLTGANLAESNVDRNTNFTDAMLTGAALLDGANIP